MQTAACAAHYSTICQHTSKTKETRNHSQPSKLHSALVMMQEAAATLCILHSFFPFTVQKYTMEEAAARAERLAKMRHLMFYAELKAKRLAKIKSKEHHRWVDRAANGTSAILDIYEIDICRSYA